MSSIVNGASAAADDFPETDDVVARRRFIERHAQRSRIDDAEIHAGGFRAEQYRSSLGIGRECQRVEKRALRSIDAKAPQTFAKHRREAMYARAIVASLRTVINGVHAGDHGEQHLRRADIRRRLFAPDVLLTRLQRQPIRRRALRIDRDADEPPGSERLKASRVAR
jgi:hypothetical protein